VKVEVGVRVAVAVGVKVGVDVKVAVGEGVKVGVEVNVAVGDGVKVGVNVKVDVGERVAEGFTALKEKDCKDFVAVDDGVKVGVWVGNLVWVGDGVIEFVEVGVMVRVRVGVFCGLGVAVKVEVERTVGVKLAVTIVTVAEFANVFVGDFSTGEDVIVGFSLTVAVDGTTEGIGCVGSSRFSNGFPMTRSAPPRLIIINPMPNARQPVAICCLRRGQLSIRRLLWMERRLERRLRPPPRINIAAKIMIPMRISMRAL
jgi:hypothetical protein